LCWFERVRVEPLLCCPWVCIGVVGGGQVVRGRISGGV
jgi:hypothetical protein